MLTWLIFAGPATYMASIKNALRKQCNKNQIAKSLSQHYNYSSNNAISSFKQAKCCNICPLENFKISNKTTFSSTSQPANRNWPRAYTTMYIAFKLSENICYFRQHEPLLYRLQYSLCAIAHSLFIHSNWLMFLL